MCPRQTATQPPRGGPSGTLAAQLRSPGWEAPPTGRWLGSAANGEKTATTGPPSGTRHDPSPERPQGISHVHALWHQIQASCRGHSGWLPCVGALPGPLPTMSATSPEPDQGGGLRWAPKMSPEGPEVDSHLGLGFAEAADRHWLCQVETQHLEVNWWWHGDKRRQPVGHLVHQHHTQLLMHRSPGPPSSFSKFAAVLRSASANQKLVRNRRRWPLIYSTWALKWCGG